MTPATQPLSPLHEAALTYAEEWGLAVMPLWWIDPATTQCGCGSPDCASPGKHPLTSLVPAGLTQATRDPEQITLWWSRFPQANVAIRTGEGLCVVDIDPRHGGTRDALPPLDTLSVATGSGGEHLYLRLPPGVEVRNSASRLAQGVDVRGDGGYVVAPPSLHASGAYYEWGDGDAIAPMPEELLTRLAHQPRPAETHAATHGGARYITGGRNEALTQQAGAMRRRGMPESAIRAALHEVNRVQCSPPLPEREVEQIARGIMRYEPEGQAQPAPTSDPWRWNTTSITLTAHLEPPVWLCESLQLGPGRPTGLVGYGGTGKSYIAMALALCIATGSPFLDHPVAQGRVRWGSWEMGRPATLSRFRALANGMGLTVPDGHLEVSTHPSVYLTTEGIEQALVAEVQGWDLVVLDSLRRMVPGVDENSSQVSQYLDILTRVSEHTGCTFLVLHHAGKSPADGSKRSPRESARGSSAITDALGAMWVVEGEGAGAPRVMTHARAHEAAEGECEPITLTLTYPEVTGGYPCGKRPLAVTKVTQEELHEARRRQRRAKGNEDWNERLGEIAALIRAEPGIAFGKLCGLAQMRAEFVRNAVEELKQEGRIVLKERGRVKRYYCLEDGEREYVEMGDFAEEGGYG